MYDEAMDAFEKNGLIRYSKDGLLYLAEMRYDRLESKMDHLACFAGNYTHFILKFIMSFTTRIRNFNLNYATTIGGMFALGAHTDPNKSGNSQMNPRAERHMKIAEGITNTCHESYIRTQTRLG